MQDCMDGQGFISVPVFDTPKTSKRSIFVPKEMQRQENKKNEPSFFNNDYEDVLKNT